MTNEEILKLINEFTERETERHIDVIPSDRVVTLINSDYEFIPGFIPEIRVDLDINSRSIRYYVSELFVSEDVFNTIDNLMYTISSMSFDDMISDCVEQGTQMYKNAKSKEEVSFINQVSRYTYVEFNRIESVPEDGIVHLAYTTYNFNDDYDDEHEIQVDFDINRKSFLNYIDGELVLVEARDSLDDAGNEISGCSFDDMIRDCVRKGIEMYG